MRRSDDPEAERNIKKAAQILNDQEMIRKIGKRSKLSGFISGKHFNRCKRLHLLLAQAFRVSHFRAFLKECGDIPPYLHSLFHELHEHPSLEHTKSLERRDDHNLFMQKY